MTEEMKKCPYCGQEILAVAQKCKHCGKWLNEEVQDKTIKITIPKAYQSWDIRIFAIWGILCLLQGIIVFCSAQSAIHEIEGALFVLIATILAVGICILGELRSKNR